MKFEFYVDKIYSYQNCIKHSKNSVYRNANYNKYQYQIIKQIEDNDKYSDYEIEDIDLEVTIELYFKIPKNSSKKKIDELNGSYCNKHIDLDNIAKLLNDIIFDYYLGEDANIVKLNMIKKWYKTENNEDDYYDKIIYSIEKI